MHVKVLLSLLLLQLLLLLLLLLLLFQRKIRKINSEWNSCLQLPLFS